MTLLTLREPLALCVVVLNMGCARQEPPPASNSGAVEVVCSYAPSQSTAVSHISSVAGGSAVTAAAIAKAAGLSAVMHSSGAYIFTGSAGYVATTIGTAAALPVVVVVGVTASGLAATVELVCASRNHPALAAKVEAAAEKYWKLSRTMVGDAASDSADAVAPIVAKIESITKSAKEAIFE